MAQIEVDRARSIPNGRPQHPAILGLDDIGEPGIAVVGFGLEFAAEIGLGVGGQHRDRPAAVAGDEQRTVVGDELCRQGDGDEADKEPQAAPAAAVGAQHGDPPAIESRQVHD